MKNRILFALAGVLLAVGLFGATVARAQDIEFPEHVFTPVGFDDNDSAQLVLFGHFPDTCYHAGPAVANIRGRTIMIRNVSTHETGPSCIKAPVPWSTTVNLGPLTAGNYSVAVLTPDGTLKFFPDLVVAKARTERIDEYNYAYVNGAIITRVDVNSGILKPILTISGSFSLTCMELKDVNISEENNVIVVLPIVRLRRDIPCGYPFAPIPFTKQVTLDPKTSEHTLVHIRSGNGQAVNQVIDY